MPSKPQFFVCVAEPARTLSHYGNISYRIGEIASRERVRNSLAAIPAAEPLFAGLQKNLAVNGVDLDRTPFKLGQWINIEADGITRVESGDAAALERARFLLRETQRPPYVIPEQV